MQVQIKKLREDAVIPEYATEGSAGFDLVATENVKIFPCTTEIIPTGLAVAIPQGYEMQIRPRSGLSAKTMLRVANAPGTVDSDYRGEIKILISNHGVEPYKVNKGNRIAQGVITAVKQVNFEKVTVLSETARGAGGMGSTGLEGGVTNE